MTLQHLLLHTTLKADDRIRQDRLLDCHGWHAGALYLNCLAKRLEGVMY